MIGAGARAFALLTLLCAGCKTPTEIVLRIDTVDGTPDKILCRLHRSVPFNTNPQTPGFVVAVLDGADLELQVTPQGAQTTISLLPSPSGPNDLRVAVTARQFKTDPPDPQETTFTEGAAKELRFRLTYVPPPPPDMAVKHDLRKPDDLAGIDLAGIDATSPKDAETDSK